MGFKQDNQDKPYDSYNATYRWIWKTGILQTPVAGQNPGAGIGGQGTSLDRLPSVICAAAAPSGQLIVSFTATRKSAPPIVPHPDPGFPGLWLAEADLILESPALTEDGMNRGFTAIGKYVYLLYQPVWVEDGPTMGITPYDDGTQETDGLGNMTNFGAANFDKSLWGFAELKTL